LFLLNEIEDQATNQEPCFPLPGKQNYSSAQALLLLALMNSAPAELLHLLVHAALQPSQAASAAKLRSGGLKKTPASMPASVYAYERNKPFFEENAALPDAIGRGSVNR